MKTLIFKPVALLLMSFMLFSAAADAQNCSKKKLASNEMLIPGMKTGIFIKA